MAASLDMSVWAGIIAPPDEGRAMAVRHLRDMADALLYGDEAYLVIVEPLAVRLLRGEGSVEPFIDRVPVWVRSAMWEAADALEAGADLAGYEAAWDAMQAAADHLEGR